MIKKLLIGTVIIFLLFSTLLASNWQLLSNLNNLKDITLKNISIEGKIYNIINGKVYEGDKQLFLFIPIQRDTVNKAIDLAGFYMWNKEDPLFYSPDLDVSELEKSVSALTNEQNLILKVLNQTTPIYPTRFLNQFVKAASLNKDFLQDPSVEKANQLIKAQKKAAQLYKEDVLALKSKITESKISPVAFNLLLSSKTVASDLNKISTNSTSILKELGKRENCLTGKGHCIRPAFSFKKPAANPPQTNPTPPDTLLASTIIYPFGIGNPRGPYSTTTPCFGWGDKFTQPIHYFYIKKVEEDLPNVNIQLATDVFFRKLHYDSQFEVELKLFRQGVKYFYIGTTAPYLCPDRTFFAEITQLNLFLETKKPILQNAELPNTPYKTYEKLFFEQKYPSFQTLSYLSDIYGYLYRQISQNPDESWVKKMLPYKEELLQRQLSIQGKIGDMPFILNRDTLYVKGPKEKLNPSKIDEAYVRNYIYTFRNFYGIMFLPFSSSVWRSNDELNYIEKVQVMGAMDSNNGGYINLTQAKEIYSQKEIKSWYTASLNQSPQ